MAATIQIPAGGPQGQADLYFGIIPPDSGRTLTWMNDVGMPRISAGMSPLLRQLDLSVAANIDILEIFGRDIEHVFTGEEAPGMYLLFALLVTAGTAPSASADWIAVEMTPLLVE